MGDKIICESCNSAEVSWVDCDIHKDAECYAVECDTSGGCGFVLRDCEDSEIVYG